MDGQWTLITGPAIEPITLQEAKDQARITQNAGDAALWRFIQAAREEAETAMNRGLLTQTWQLGLRQFYPTMTLPRAHPLQTGTGVDPIVQYYDVDGVLQVLDPTQYLVDTLNRPGRIARAPAMAWPPLQPDRLTARVLITYVVGWLTPAQVPERIKQGIRLYLTWLDRDRDGSDPQAVAARDRAYDCWTDRLSYLEPCDEY